MRLIQHVNIYVYEIRYSLHIQIKQRVLIIDQLQAWQALVLNVPPSLTCLQIV